MSDTTLVWFRRDLRLSDNAALRAAAAEGAVLPVYIHAPHEEKPWEPGAASNWWLHHSLSALQRELAAAGTPLIIRAGDTLAELQKLIDATGATAVHWNRLYDPAVVKRDAQVKQALEKIDIDCRDFGGYLLTEPGTVSNKTGNPYKVFTPFWKATLNTLQVTAPDAVPQLQPCKPSPESLPVDALGLMPEISWYEGFAQAWTPGEQAGLAQLDSFVAAEMGDYAEGRNRPDRVGTSRLSPHLHFGEVTPRQVFWSAHEALARRTAADLGAEKFLAEIGWREFAHHLLVHFPHTPRSPLREDFTDFPWRKPRKTDKAYRAWCKGTTNVPLVDAGMRELWHTGWMHNRVRMVVASFLTKNQLITWEAGARWFWDTLVDANLASNTLGWQWTAGCGADAAPFFRIFNPVRQGEKFDPDEHYVRHWCAELGDIPKGYGHSPWLADGQYPVPIVDLGESRKLALAAFQTIKKPA